MFYLRLLILWPFVKMMSVYVKRFVPYSKKLLKNLLFGEIILISLEAYFEFLIGGYMNAYSSLDTTSGEKVGRYSGYYSLIVAAVVLPVFMIYVICQPKDRLRDPDFEQRWGSLYSGIRIDNKW